MCSQLIIYSCITHKDVGNYFIVKWLQTGCPKKMYTHKVNIPYYNVYTSFWDILYIATRISFLFLLHHSIISYVIQGERKTQVQLCSHLSQSKPSINGVCSVDWLCTGSDNLTYKLHRTLDIGTICGIICDIPVVITVIMTKDIFIWIVDVLFW
jgi:hypothetical protein